MVNEIGSEDVVEALAWIGDGVAPIDDLGVEVGGGRIVEGDVVVKVLDGLLVKIG